MVYQSKFVAVVKVGNKILREREDNTVFLPFGSEYSLVFQNKDSRKAVVSITIDDMDVLYGNRLVVAGGDELQLDRFLSDMNSGARFKFIQKTEKIQNHRGDRVGDGLVRVEYWFEKWSLPLFGGITTSSSWYNYDNPLNGYPHIYGGCIGSSSGSLRSCSSSVFSASTVLCETTESVKPMENEGITVEGDDSFTAFRSTFTNTLEEQSHTIIFQLKGYDGSNNVTDAIGVKDKIVCSSCGTKFKSDAKQKFCSECGTRLL